jgi:catalase (peroxidase I)
LGNEGAVDGSIQFEIEMSRPNRLVSDAVYSILLFASDQVSFADALVLGGALAIKSCLGPQINYKYGRVDALKAGPPGLLFEEDGIDSDARIQDMGMTTGDLLVLVAGGHSVATVQAEAPFDATPESKLST